MFLNSLKYKKLCLFFQKVGRMRKKQTTYKIYHKYTPKPINSQKTISMFLQKPTVSTQKHEPSISTGIYHRCKVRFQAPLDLVLASICIFIFYNT